jgi:hypothetical protein
VSVVARVGLVFTVPALIACAAFGPRERDAHSSSAVNNAAVVRPEPSAAASGAAEETPSPDDESNGTVDLYGNQVSDAVAKYKLDATGSLYELHSPQTEVPKLASPKS